MPKKNIIHTAHTSSSGSLTSSYTTLAAWGIAISWALDAKGLNAEDIFTEAGLSLTDFEDKPSGRIPIDNMTRLWGVAIEATSDPAFGLSVSEHVHALHFKALGMLTVSCKNLAQAMEKIVSYHALVSNSVQLQLIHEPDKMGLVIRAVEGVSISPASIDAFYSVIVKFCRSMLGSGDLVSLVDLKRAKPASAQAWLALFNAQVNFQQEENCLWLNRVLLEKPSLHFDEKVQQMNENAVQDYLHNMNANTWVEKCKKNMVIGLNQEAANLTKIAQQLNLSERTLARKLREEGVNFRQILQQKKQDLAHYYLVETDQSITNIALNLGFKDTSNFTRAFQRWNKISPSEYRAQKK